MKFNFNFLNKRYGINAYSQPIKNKLVQGYCNRCEDGFYIITLDYDDMELDCVTSEVKRLQNDFQLGNFYIFHSGHGYHAVCLDKVTFKELLLIMQNSSIDKDYMEVPLYSGKKLWVLRVTDKADQELKHQTTICSVYEGSIPQSTAHANLLNSLFSLDINLSNPDNRKLLKLAQYPIS